MKTVDYTLMFVTDERIRDDASFFAILEASLKGGVTIVQLREKKLHTQHFYQRAVIAQQLCARYHVPFLINDRVDIALAVNADGVHIGQTDMPATIARQLLGDDAIIGLSVSNAQQALEANNLAIDYIGLSPIFGTTTKTEHLEPPLGIKGLQQLKTISNHPIVCIGGITTKNAAPILHHGADGLAVVSAIAQAQHPEQAAQQFKQLIAQADTKEGT